MSAFSESIVISGPPFRVWNTLADIGSIDEWSPGVVASRKTTPGNAGVGASRHCDLGGNHYLDITTQPRNVRISPTSSAVVHSSREPAEHGALTGLRRALEARVVKKPENRGLIVVGEPVMRMEPRESRPPAC